MEKESRNSAEKTRDDGLGKGRSVNRLNIQYKAKGAEEMKIKIPIQFINIGVKYLPKDIKASLDKLGIDICQSSDLIKDKALRGPFIEIETLTLKLIISVE